MTKKNILLLLTLFMSLTASWAQIGTWRNFLAYHDVQQIQQAGDYLFVMASNSLYQYNKNDQSIFTYDRVNGMNSVGITHIKWCQQAKRLVVVYSNSNIDLVDTGGNITNISDIYSKAIIGGKTIHNITIKEQYAYLSCDFGIVKVNVKTAEISETYMLDFAVENIAFQGNNIYAKSSNTVWTAELSKNLIDPANWSQTTTAPSFSEDTSDYDNNIDLVKTLQPGGPHYNTFGKLRIHNHQLYSVNGSMAQKASIQILDNKSYNWTIFDTELEQKLGHRFVGLVGIDINPNNNNEITVCGQTGVYEFNNGIFIKEYTNDNSPLKTAQTVGNNNKNYVVVTDGIFDASGNYWCLNSISPSTSILELTHDKQWISHHQNKLMLSNGWSMDDMRSMFFASDGTLWFVNNYYRVPATVRYNTETKELTLYDNFTNQDGASKTIYGVRCAAEDKEKNVWVGTNAGLYLLEYSTISAGLQNYIQVKVPRNDGTDYADYLLDNVNILCIAIDEANRKWIGTEKNGVYLISADNMQKIHQFTTDNSPIISNNIQSIAINHDTGEVFFGTDSGLCSYISDATTTSTEMTKDNVWAYPNPVSPDYTGLITVTGLSYQSDVKIVASNGALIAEGRSNGGSFTWDGCNKKGERVASGIYMVVAATKEGEKGTVCKIAIVR